MHGIVHSISLECLLNSSNCTLVTKSLRNSRLVRCWLVLAHLNSVCTYPIASMYSNYLWTSSNPMIASIDP